MNVIAIDKALRREADDLLYASGLLSLLQRYGTPHVHGSYALQFMAWRDLDVYLVTDSLAVDAFFELGGMIATTLEPVRMQFRNEWIGQTPGLPAGLYWGVHLDSRSRETWKIDLWTITSLQYDILMAHHSALAQRLTPASRRTILELKTHYWRDPQYRRSFMSQDLYQAVLDRGINTVEGVEQYLQQRDQQI